MRWRGLIIGTLLVEKSGYKEKIRIVLVLALFTYIAAFLLQPIGGLHSPYTSWSLYSTSAAFAIWAALYWCIDIRGWKKGTGSHTHHRAKLSLPVPDVPLLDIYLLAHRSDLLRSIGAKHRRGNYPCDTLCGFPRCNYRHCDEEENSAEGVNACYPENTASLLIPFGPARRLSRTGYRNRFGIHFRVYGNRCGKY